MTDFNVYAPPKSDIADPTLDQHAPARLASRWDRFAAAIVDALAMLPVLFLEVSVSFADAQTPLEALLQTLVSYGIYFAINGYLLATKGQSVGKWVIGIRIVSVKDDQLVPFGKLVVLRYLPLAASEVHLWLTVLVVVDVLLIFRSDRRCLHDLIAGTKVVNSANKRTRRRTPA